MTIAYFFVFLLCLLSCGSCVSGSEELSTADLLVVEFAWKAQLEVDAERETAHSSNNLSEGTRMLWKEAGHSRCPRWVADDPVLVQCLDAIEYTINPEPGLLRVVRPEHITFSTMSTTEETTESSEPGAIPEKSNEKESSDKPATPSDLTKNSEMATESQKHNHYMAFLLLGPIDDFFSEKLLRCVSEVAGAFPNVYFVVGIGPQFSMFASRYTLRGFPSLLLFKGGIFQSQFRRAQRKTSKSFQTGISWLSKSTLFATEKNCSTVTSSEVAVWLAEQMKQFPKAMARNISVPTKQLEPLYDDWHTDFVLWLSKVFVALKVAMWIRRKYF